MKHKYKIINGKCVIPDGATEIAFEDFSHRRLREIQIPKSVTVIDSGAFFYCEHLTSVSIPDSVTEIRSQAFEGCSKLKSIQIPASVVSIERNSFASCPALESIEVDNANPVYRSASNTLLSKDGKTLLLGCKTSVIPKSVTTIGDYAFCGSRVTQVDIPASVTAIGDLAFYDCTKLKRIVIPKIVTAIGDLAFYNCTKLKSIVIPQNVNEWGCQVFNCCPQLKEIVLLCPMECECQCQYTFSGCEFTDLYLSYGPERYESLAKSLLESDVDINNVTLHVPKGTEWTYRRHPFYGGFGMIKGS